MDESSDESSIDFAFLLHLVEQVGADGDTPLEGFLERLSDEDRDLTQELMDAGEVDTHGTVLDLLAAVKPPLDEALTEEDTEDVE